MRAFLVASQKVVSLEFRFAAWASALSAGQLSMAYRTAAPVRLFVAKA
jgi:hypothetical protein